MMSNGLINNFYIVPIPLFVGDRICQTHFPKSFLIKENIKDGPEQSKRSRVSFSNLMYNNSKHV